MPKRVHFIASTFFKSRIKVTKRTNKQIHSRKDLKKVERIPKKCRVIEGKGQETFQKQMTANIGNVKGSY